MIESRKRANVIENTRQKAILYHDTVAIYFDRIREEIDKLEEVVDDQIWTLPKYREILFVK
jgi:glutamine synthetase